MECFRICVLEFEDGVILTVGLSHVSNKLLFATHADMTTSEKTSEQEKMVVGCYCLKIRPTQSLFCICLHKRVSKTRGQTVINRVQVLWDIFHTTRAHFTDMV